MKILGIHYETHDAGAAIIENDSVLAAIAEERLSRKKEDGSFPSLAIQEALNLSGLDIKDIDAIAISGEKNVIKNYGQHAMYELQPLLHTLPKIPKYFSLKDSFKLILTNSGIGQVKNIYKKRGDLKRFLNESKSKGFTGKIYFVAHDKAHAASAYFSSGFEKCTIPVLEGYSYQNASSIWIGEDNKLKRIKSIPWPHSPGQFYRCVTMILGFSPRRHAGKITGLAAYGDHKKNYEKTSSLIKYINNSLYVDPLTYILQYQYKLKPVLPVYFEGESREDISAAFQKVLEEVLEKLVDDTIKETGIKEVALAGGVAANVKVNQRIASLDSVSEIHVHPAMSDSGQALGAAISIAFDENLIDMKNTKTINDVYFGTDIESENIEDLLKSEGLSYTRPQNVAKEVAEHLADKKVIAICTGRMEYGPRALGARSIMYSPTESEVNDWLNKRLNRTEFMPFAPVTLAEFAADCYDNELLKKTNKATEFMTVSIDCSDEMKLKQPAVVHVDGTARPQIIYREKNPLYYDILKEFHIITGIPSLVNTSFNMHEEPIVRSAEDAIRSFKASKIDFLLIGNILIQSN